MPPLPSLAVHRYRFLQELKVALGAAPTRALIEQVALAYDVFVRAIVVTGHQRLAPNTRHDLFRETLSRGFRYSCRHRRGPMRRSKSNCVWMDSSRVESGNKALARVPVSYPKLDIFLRYRAPENPRTRQRLHPAKPPDK